MRPNRNYGDYDYGCYDDVENVRNHSFDRKEVNGCEDAMKGEGVCICYLCWMRNQTKEGEQYEREGLEEEEEDEHAQVRQKACKSVHRDEGLDCWVSAMRSSCFDYCRQLMSQKIV